MRRREPDVPVTTSSSPQDPARIHIRSPRGSARSYVAARGTHPTRKHEGTPVRWCGPNRTEQHFGWVAEYERKRLGERTKAGIERARPDGKQIVRKPVLLPAARDLVRAGVPVAEAGRRKGLSRSSLRRFLDTTSGAGTRPGGR